MTALKVIFAVMIFAAALSVITFPAIYEFRHQNIGLGLLAILIFLSGVFGGGIYGWVLWKLGLSKGGFKPWVKRLFGAKPSPEIDGGTA